MTDRREMKPYIVCTGENGRAVIYGYCEADPIAGQPIIVHKARMVLYWSSECGGLLGLAARGPQTKTRLTHAVDRTGLSAVTEWVDVSASAAQGMDQWPAA